MTRPRLGARQAEALMRRFGLTYEHLVGVRFAVNVFAASAITWFTLSAWGVKNPIWAIASMVAASDPSPGEARRMFASRLINVLVGCAVGALFIVMGTENDWELPTALAVTVLISSYLVKVKTMWRQAPITAAIVIAAGLTAGSTTSGLESGLRKVAEVIYGCLVGLIVSLVMAQLWRIQPSEPGAAS